MDGNPKLSEPIPSMDDNPQLSDPYPSIDSDPQSSEPNSSMDGNPKLSSMDGNPKLSEPIPSMDDNPQSSEPNPSMDSDPQSPEPNPSMDCDPQSPEPTPSMDSDPQSSEGQLSPINMSYLKADETSEAELVTEDKILSQEYLQLNPACPGYQLPKGKPVLLYQCPVCPRVIPTIDYFTQHVAAHPTPTKIDNIKDVLVAKAVSFGGDLYSVCPLCHVLCAPNEGM